MRVRLEEVRPVRLTVVIEGWSDACDDRKRHRRILARVVVAVDVVVDLDRV